MAKRSKPAGRWFRIQTPSEETQCPQCGFPLYVGDQAFEQAPSEVVVCSPLCAEEVSVSEPADYGSRITKRDAS